MKQTATKSSNVKASKSKPSKVIHAIHSLRDLKQARNNPREITVQNLNHLKSSITEFGDISGIVFNVRTGELVSGHQRVLALTEAFGNLAIESGTIHVPTGEVFQVRLVDWSEEDQLAASLAANSPTVQGTFTSEVSSLLSNLSSLLPNVYESLGFADLQPVSFSGPASWEADQQTTRTWDDSPEAREGKAITEEIPKDLVLEARFDVRVPELLADDMTDRLLKLTGDLQGASVRRIE